MSKLPKLNRERLLQFVDVLKEADPKKFDMCHWAKSCQRGLGLSPSQFESETCGTSACALGTAAVSPCFVEQGLYLRRGKPDAALAVHFVNENGEHFTDFGAGQAFFGLSFAEAWWLFSPSAYTRPLHGMSEDIEPRRVADRVKFLLDNTEVGCSARAPLQRALERGWLDSM